MHHDPPPLLMLLLRGPMTIELLYFDGCPNRKPVLERVRELVARQATDAEIVPHRVERDEEAQRLRFLGSPTVRVDGRDVEPGADVREDFGLKCRLYRTEDGLTGTPAEEWLLAALGADPACASEDPEAADASPLQCRRVPSSAMPG
jgi:hypothetical protein